MPSVLGCLGCLRFVGLRCPFPSYNPTHASKHDRLLGLHVYRKAPNASLPLKHLKCLIHHAHTHVTQESLTGVLWQHTHTHATPISRPLHPLPYRRTVIDKETLTGWLPVPVRLGTCVGHATGEGGGCVYSMRVFLCVCLCWSFCGGHLNSELENTASESKVLLCIGYQRI